VLGAVVADECFGGSTERSTRAWSPPRKDFRRSCSER